MSGAPLTQRTEALLRRLVRRSANDAVKRLVARTRAEDVAAAMEHLTWSEQRRLYQLIDDLDYAAEVLANLSDEASRQVTRDMGEEQVVELIERMDPDDATDVVELLPDQIRARVIEAIEDEEDRTEVRALLDWPSESAGGIMSPAVFQMPHTASCGDAVERLRAEHDDLETDYLYVVDEFGKLVGVVGLRALVTNRLSTNLADIMNPDVIVVGPLEDQEEVARFVARYDLLAVPVVDSHHRLLGVVTVDDVVDVIRDEAAEDMMLMAGVGEEALDLANTTVFSQAYHRAGWLLATIGGGILMAEIIGTYEHTLKAVAVLAGFIPVIMGMGGNVGIQSGTIAVRGLATGHVQLTGAVRFILREAQVGVLLGVFYALLLGGYGIARYWIDGPLVGVSVGVSVGLAIVLASVLGAGIPVLLERLGVDPAIATGPFVTTGVDIIGIVVYFNVARLLLGL